MPRNAHKACSVRRPRRFVILIMVVRLILVLSGVGLMGWLVLTGQSAPAAAGAIAVVVTATSEAAVRMTDRSMLQE